jgi:16S rRNA (adenine1518-N6/adenine1519-N6)-dimethyltransferase
MSQRPRKRFGQHFLTATEIIDDIVAAVAPHSGDVIVEIGPGRGALTLPLSRHDVRLHAIELDRDLASGLERTFAGNENVTIHQADALDFDFSGLGQNLRIVGNLPYNISTPLLFQLIGHRSAILDLHVMLQKEVVDRMVAQPGSKDYGRLTIMLASCMETVPLFDVPPEAFSPPPRVRSAVARMRPLPDMRPSSVDRERLSAIVAAAFSKRRKRPSAPNRYRWPAGSNSRNSSAAEPGD